MSMLVEPDGVTEGWIYVWSENEDGTAKVYGSGPVAKVTLQGESHFVPREVSA